MKKIKTGAFRIELKDGIINIYSKLDLDNCLVRVYETSTNLIVHSTKFDIRQDCNPWWLKCGLGELSKLNGLKITILHNDNIIHEEIIKLNKNIRNDKLLPTEIKYPSTESNCWAPFWEINLKKIYEHNNTRVKKGDVVVDLGANIGFFSLYAIMNGASKVYSVEASNNTFKSLSENVNKFNIYPFNVAISQGETKIFYLSDTTGSSSIYKQTNNVEIVNCITFEKFIQENKIEHINFLKIDIEGSEYEMFNTIDENYLRNNIDTIFLEYHIIDNYNIDDIISKLIKNNYECIMTESNDEFGMMVATNKKINNAHFNNNAR